jgi:flagellar motor switch/type III secretory pathway protein FliN
MAAVLASESLKEILAACHASLDQVAAALEHAFGEPFQVQVAGSGAWDPSRVPADLQSAGLAMVASAGGQALLLLMPESGNLQPQWYQTLDDEQTSRLAELAQELASLWLPPRTAVGRFETAYLPSLAEAVLRGAVCAGAAQVTIHLTNPSGQQGTLCLIWPAQSPADVLNTGLPTPVPPKAAWPARQHSATPVGRPSKPDPDALPSYARSLLHIQVPVTVALASQRLPLKRILELGPGSLLQFEKSCEELLELEVNGHRVAVGEAVKVGDKFGIRVSAMILPEERFVPVGGRQR